MTAVLPASIQRKAFGLLKEYTEKKGRVSSEKPVQLRIADFGMRIEHQ
jgi:hypothetical protein